MQEKKATTNSPSIVDQMASLDKLKETYTCLIRQVCLEQALSILVHKADEIVYSDALTGTTTHVDVIMRSITTLDDKLHKVVYLGDFKNASLTAGTDLTPQAMKQVELAIRCAQMQLQNTVLAGLQMAWSCGWAGKDTTDDQLFVWTDTETYALTKQPLSMVHRESVPDAKQLERVVLLITIHVPVPWRRRHMATQVIAHLEARANKELKRRLVVGPIIGESGAIEMILKQRGYTTLQPSFMMQDKFQ